MTREQYSAVEEFRKNFKAKIEEWKRAAPNLTGLQQAAAK